MMERHKHAELIKAWADGAEIECRQGSSTTWVTVESPTWSIHGTYRIKTEPKPDIVEWHNVVRSGCTPTDKPNIKLTFDGATGVLKSAEVL